VREVKTFLGLHICLHLSVHLVLVFPQRVKVFVLTSELQHILSFGEYNFDSFERNVILILRKKFIKFIFLKSLHTANNLSEIQDTFLIKIYKMF
jgi:hypothetical protein